MLSHLDSLETVELALCIEEELKNSGSLELDVSLLNRLSCTPYRCLLEADVSGTPLKGEVTVIAREGSKVLFVTQNVDRFGVGIERQIGIIQDSKIYQTLHRALFELR